MRKKWVKRSDVIILLMTAFWFIIGLWAAVLVTVQIIQGAYSNGLGDVLMYVGGPMTGGIATWFIKNMVENSAKAKANPDYLKTHDGDDNYNGAA